MGILSVLGEIVLRVGSFITNSASSSFKSMSYDRNLPKDGREKYSELSEGFADYADKMGSKADELRERRHNQNEND